MEIPARIGGPYHAYRFVYVDPHEREHETTVLIRDHREFIVRALRRLPKGRLTWSAAIMSSADCSVSDASEIITKIRTWLESVAGMEEARRVLGEVQSPSRLPNCS